MLNVAEQLNAQGFHNDAFNVALWAFRFERSVDFWTRKVINAYQTVINNIYISQGEVFEGHAVNILDNIDTEDSLKL